MGLSWDTNFADVCCGFLEFIQANNLKLGHDHFFHILSCSLPSSQYMLYSSDLLTDYLKTYSTNTVNSQINVPTFSEIPDLVMIFSCPDNSSI
jgi:hypothetical protein